MKFGRKAGVKVLTKKRELFCYHYAEHWNGTKAAIQAGFSKKSAGATADDLLKIPEIQARIGEIRLNVEESCGISKMMIVNEHKKIAFSSISHLHNTWTELVEFEKLTDTQKECIKKTVYQTKKVPRYDIETGKVETVEVEYVKIELHDKQKSLESISKLMGYDRTIGKGPADPDESQKVTGFEIEAPK